MGEYRLVLIESDAAWRKNIKAMMAKMGYWVIGEAEDGLTGLKLIRARQPDLAIIEAFLPGMDGHEVARIAYEDKLAPVILIASSTQQNLIEKAKIARVFAFLLKPELEYNLVPAIELALTNYQEIVRLENQVKELKETLETRKFVERAKGILMETLGISEAEAFKRIQRQSMNRRISMRAVAEAIILAHNL
ncbi:MAG TPA: ANTAR domain-containing protein [Bacillota bacterium]|jgi:response regulator NasT|nr:ANTAR domain-containing protein [Peptococcaceae bacterium MAG4]NLW38051.1 ANTAR domain-containing protein [Peptococcaceae bacterium]HPU35753.1 ANTAR domain-containing protein [Bacillota bacterium]HPZ43102.1 ANTAR domain-containing protein [Bacillota bacterium]HQD75216.1 ANTAR domain-containing protein [Bacillota bacterium]